MIEWEKELDRLLKSNFKEPDPFRKINSEIVLYGAGAMGKMAIDIMKTVNTKPKYIVDKTFEGKLFGIKVIKPHEIPECDRDKATFVISISSIPVEPIFDFLKGLGCKDIRHFYDYSEIAFPKAMPNGWVKKDISEEDIDGIKHTFKALEHNDFSVAHYLQFLWWRLKREEVLFQDHPVLSGKKFFKSQCMPKLTDHECLLDGGAHFGQTVKDFIKNNLLYFYRLYYSNCDFADDFSSTNYRKL